MKQTKQAIKKTNPKELVTEAQKDLFTKTLRSNGGNVSKALITSNLSRATAYRHFKDDKAFAEGWLDALEASNDELFTEARRRATEGFEESVYHNGQVVGKVQKYSDTLLIFLLKQSEAQKKWRNRLIQAGNLALDTVRKEGERLQLEDEAILQIQTAITERLNDIMLV